MRKKQQRNKIQRRKNNKIKLNIKYNNYQNINGGIY
jgi:hypothetical protein